MQVDSLAMDFRAYTSRAATAELISRLELLGPADEVISTRFDGVLHDRHRVQSPQFDGLISIDTEKWTQIKARFGMLGLRFGTGRIAVEDTPILLELWRDEEGEYRWYRVAAEWSLSSMRIRKCRDARWFPLTNDFLTELLTRSRSPKEAPHSAPRKVIPVKTRQSESY